MGTAYLNLAGVANSFAYTAPVDISGDIDVRIRLAANDFTPSTAMALVAQRSSSSGFANEWSLQINAGTTGTLRWDWRDGAGTDRAATSTIGPGSADNVETWLRVTHDVDNSAGGNDVKFWKSNDGTAWTQIGTTVTQAFTTALRTTVATKLEVGAFFDGSTAPLAGKVYEAQVRSGIDGTLAANPIFHEQANATTSFADAQGNTWTVGSAATIEGQTGGSTAQILVPSADINVGSWVREPTGGTLWSAIAEKLDTSMIRLGAGVYGSTARFKLSTAGSPVSGTRTFRARVSRDGVTNTTFTITLREGGGTTVGGGLLRGTASTTRTVDGWETVSVVVTDPIDDYSNLYVEVLATAA